MMASFGSSACCRAVSSSVSFTYISVSNPSGSAHCDEDCWQVQGTSKGGGGGSRFRMVLPVPSI